MPFDSKTRAASISRRWMLKSGATAMLACCGLRSISAQANALRVGSAAPPASLVTLEDRHISTADLLGNVIILTFWATWCGPCREELPLLSRYAEQHEAKGLRILGFSLDETEQMTEVTRVAQSLHFPVGLLSHSSASGYGRIWRLPVNFTIDRAGMLVNDGWKEKKPAWTAERLAEIVTPMLSAVAGAGR